MTLKKNTLVDYVISSYHITLTQSTLWVGKTSWACACQFRVMDNGYSLFLASKGTVERETAQ